jgi:nucleotide-binding universal stress UspA family protein
MKAPGAIGHDVGARRLAVKILLAVDGSEASTIAISAVESLSLPPDSTVELLTVIPDTPWTYGPWPAVAMIQSQDALDRADADVRAWLDDIVAGMTTHGRTIHTMVRHGRPASEIVFEADRFEADMLVVGARGHSAVERIFVGSVSSEVVDEARCPVFVVRSLGVRRILVATDGSADGELAAAFVGTSRIFGDPAVKVISVVDPGTPWWAGMAAVDATAAVDVYATVVDVAQKQAREFATATAERLGFDNVLAESRRMEGEVGSTIVNAANAWHADVVVLGTRGHGAAHRTLVGSTSRHVLHRAPMSVLIVRPSRTGRSARADAA